MVAPDKPRRANSPPPVLRKTRRCKAQRSLIDLDAPGLNLPSSQTRQQIAQCLAFGGRSVEFPVRAGHQKLFGPPPTSNEHTVFVVDEHPNFGLGAHSMTRFSTSRSANTESPKPQ